MTKKIVYKFLWIPAFAGMTMMLFAATALANNITVSNVSITSQNATNKTANVQFDITWQNSWMNSVNYDAAWVFIKYSTDGGITWNHATLAATGGTATTSGNGLINPSGYSLGSGTALQIIVPTETNSGKKGAFLQRAANGTGTLTTTGVQLVWDWNANGLSASTTARVQVFAIEMVYIPTGSFYLGDGTTTSVTGQFIVGTSSLSPFQVNLQGAMTLGGGSSNLGNNNASGMFTADDWNNTTSQTLASAFPEGYNAFYMMKYDVSQGQYRDFLNTLTRTQQATRVATSPIGTGTTTVTNVFVMSATSSPSFRNGIRVISPIPSSGPITFGCDVGNTGTLNGSSDGEWIAVNHLSWMDATAYAAWAGLRPFTEFEYEKAARGPNTANSGEYAWGSTTITQATSINNSGQNSEIAGNAGNPNGLCVYGNVVGGPMRCGFAATATTTRAQAGASYWGIMDLSGQLWKRIVTVGNTTGRGFQGTNGTGVLSANGNATNSDWPGYSSGEVTGATGAGFRGGDWYDSNTLARISDRYNAVSVDASRNYERGARFTRTAP